MYFAHVTQSRTGRAWAVLISLVIVGILIAAIVLLCSRSREPFDMDELYRILD
jgi:hypothetical protein